MTWIIGVQLTEGKRIHNLWKDEEKVALVEFLTEETQEEVEKAIRILNLIENQTALDEEAEELGLGNLLR